MTRVSDSSCRSRNGLLRRGHRLLLTILGSILFLAGCQDTPTQVPHSANLAETAESGSITSLLLVIDPSSIYVGETASATLTAYDSNGKVVDLTYELVSWWLDPSTYANVESQYKCGWYACATIKGVDGPGDVSVFASVDGIVTAATLKVKKADPIVVSSISGPSLIELAGQYTWSVTASGGDGTYSYDWQHSYDGGATWSSILLGNGSSSFTRQVNNPDYLHLRVTVSSGNATPVTTASHLVDARNAFDGHISGETKIRSSGYYTYEAMPKGGSGTYTYNWYGGASGTGKTVTLWFEECTPSKILYVDISDGRYTITREISILNEMEMYC